MDKSLIVAAFMVLALVGCNENEGNSPGHGNRPSRQPPNRPWERRAGAPGGVS